MISTRRGTATFGDYELDFDGAELRREGRVVKLQPQPFKLLALLVSQAGSLVTRDEIRRELWPEDTFVDFDQAVNFAIRQIREALRDDADRPLYVHTVPKRGYRFIAPVGVPVRDTPHRGGESRLQRAIWHNIVELRLAEVRRTRWLAIIGVLLVATLAVLVTLLLR